MSDNIANQKLKLLPYAKLTIYIVIVAFCSVLMGLVAVTGDIKITILVLGILVGMALLSLENGILVNLMLFIVLLVVGQLKYFLGLSSAIWIVYGFGLIFYLKYVLSFFEAKSNHLLGTDPILTLIVLYFLLFVMSLTINFSTVFQAVSGFKAYILLWGFYFVVVAGALSLKQIERVWHWFLWLIVFQLPLVLYQYFFVASKRSITSIDGMSWDAVVGGFGGNPEGGGASGAMAYFLITMLVFITALLVRGQVGKSTYAVLLSIIVTCIALAEVKVIVVLIPIGFTILFFSSLKKKPLRFLFAILAFFFLSIAILTMYNMTNKESGQRATNLSELFDQTFGYSITTDLNDRKETLGRVSSLVFWWDENGLSDPVHTLFGYGPGASKSSSSVTVGSLVSRYPYALDKTSASQILWDLGLVGLSLLIAMFLKLVNIGYQLSKSTFFTMNQQAILITSSASLMMGVVILFYKADFTTLPAVIILLLFFMGTISYFKKIYLERIQSPKT